MKRRAAGLKRGYFKGFDELISWSDAPDRWGVNENEVLIEAFVVCVVTTKISHIFRLRKLRRQVIHAI